MEPIDPDATYILMQPLLLSGVSYQRFVAAIQRGTLPNRRVGRTYQIGGRDLLVWRGRTLVDSVSPSTGRG
jgi:hypothetical protein